MCGFNHKKCGFYFYPTISYFLTKQPSLWGVYLSACLGYCITLSQSIFIFQLELLLQSSYGFTGVLFTLILNLSYHLWKRIKLYNARRFYQYPWLANIFDIDDINLHTGKMIETISSKFPPYIHSMWHWYYIDY